MAGFIRIRNCCCCGGSLKGASITIGLFYLVFAIIGSAVGNSGLWKSVSVTTADIIYGRCEEKFFMPLLGETSIVSGVINLCLLYGIITARSAFIAPWLAWNVAYPVIQLAHIIWAIITLANCDLATYQDEYNRTFIAILVCNVVSLAFVLYFAVIIYSHYKDVQEDENTKKSYGAKMLMPSKNWDEELSPYTSYNPSVATPMNWGDLPPTSSHKGPAPMPPSIQKKTAGIPRPQSIQNY